MEAEHKQEIQKIQEHVRIKDLLIADAKSKIRGMNLKYFGVSSDQLADLEKEIARTIKQVEDIADTVLQFMRNDITIGEAREKIEEITGR